MCQVCVWAGVLTQKTYDAINRFLEIWPRAEYGPAHIVLGDCNIRDANIAWCIEHWEERSAGHNPDELVATLSFLQDLRKIPQAER